MLEGPLKEEGSKVPQTFYPGGFENSFLVATVEMNQQPSELEI